MATSDYSYNGKLWRRNQTMPDENSFFHATFGVRATDADMYVDKKAKFRRMGWATFLTYFENDTMPPCLAQTMKKCLTSKENYKHLDDQGQFECYVSGIMNGKQDVTMEEIPIVATLENVKIVLFLDRTSEPVAIISPDSKMLGNYQTAKEFKGEVVLCLEETVFSRMTSVEEASAAKSDEKNTEEATSSTSQSDSGLIRYKKGGSAGSEGVQFQVGLLTVFLLNALQKLSNWKLSTENKVAGKFDDVVLESPETATLLQAKHKQSKTKKINFEDLISTNTKNDDFSIPKYFLSYEEIKMTFKLKEVIICTNASVDWKVLKYLKPQQVGHESLLHYENCNSTLYTFSDEILPQLIDNIKSYYEKNFQHKAVDKSSITEENVKCFLGHLQLFFNYPPENNVEKVIEKMLSHMKISENVYANVSPLDIYTKMLDWFQQKDGVYLTELYTKAIFSEIWRDKHWQRLEKYNIFFQNNNLSFQDSQRLFHFIVESGCLLQEIKIYRALQTIKTKILYLSPDDGAERQKRVVEAFSLPQYTILVLVLSKTVEEYVAREASSKLREILNKFGYKKVVLVADCNNKIPQRIGLSKDVVNKPITFEDLTKDTQQRLLRQKNVIFQGDNVSIQELIPKQLTEDYGKFLNSEVLETLVRNEEIKVGVPLTHLSQDIMQVYIQRNFNKNGSGVIWPETTIYGLREKVIVMSDAAGMGKSTVLTNVAMNIKKNYPHLWIIRIELNNYTKLFKDCLGKDKETIDITELLNSKYSTKLTNHLETSTFSIQEKIVLLFDGFDEIGPDYTKLTLDLLRRCQASPNCNKIFITTRPNVCSELEANLQATSFTLEPFTRKDQICFLTSFWAYNLDLDDTEREKCERYAEALLNKVVHWIDSHQPGQHHFAAVPLQIRMLAEVFQERSKHEEPQDWERCKEFLVSDKAEPDLPENMNIMRLYKMFIETKRNIFMDKGNPTGNTAANHALTDQFEDCLSYQRNLALESIFDKARCELFSCYQKDYSKVEVNTLKIGIVQKSDNEFRFVHRTFAEYFIAESLVKELSLLNQNIQFQTLLIEEILLEPRFNVIRMFFNGFLHQIVDGLSSRVFQHYQSVSHKIDSSDKRKMRLLHELATEGHVAILQLLLKCTDIAKETAVKHFDASENNYGNVLNIVLNRVLQEGLDMSDGFKTLLEYAAENNRLEMVKFLIERGANVNVGVCKPLHLATQAGHFQVSKYLTEQGADVKSTDFLDDSTVLYKAVRKSDTVVATYHLDRMLENDNLNINDANIAHAAASLGRLDVLKKLIEQGGSVNTTVEYDETPLFGAARGAQLETIKYLVQHGCDINRKDRQNRTALHIIARTLPNISVARLLIDLGIDVNVESVDKSTALHLALEFHHRDLAELLINSGANVNLHDKKGATPLHIAACNFYQNLVKLLVDKGADSNSKDNWGRTPLHLVTWNDVFLCDQYGDISIKAVSLALSKERLDIIRAIVQSGGDVNIKDVNGYTPLHLAAKWGQLDVATLLMELGVDADITDNEGRRAVHLAARWGNLDVITALVESGIDVNVKDAEGRTALHTAVNECHYNVIEYLVKSGADVSVKDHYGYTPLHLVIKNHIAYTLKNTQPPAQASNVNMDDFDILNSGQIFTKNGTDVCTLMQNLNDQLSVTLKDVDENRPSLGTISEKLEALNSSTMEIFKFMDESTKKMRSIFNLPSQKTDTDVTSKRNIDKMSLPSPIQESMRNHNKIFNIIKENKSRNSSNVPFLKGITDINSKSSIVSMTSTSSNQEAFNDTEQSQGHNSTNVAFPREDGTDFNSRSNIANMASTLLNLEVFKNMEGKGHRSSNVASPQEDGTVLYCDSMNVSSRINTNSTASTSSNQESLKHTEQSKGHNLTNVAFPKEDGTDFNSRSNIANIASTLLNLELFKNTEGKGHGSSNVASPQEDGTVLYCDSIDVNSRSNTNSTASTSSNQEALKNTEQSKGHNSTNEAFPNKDGTNFNSRSNIANVASTLLNLELFKNTEGKGHGSSNVASLQEDGTVLYCDSMAVSSRSNTNITASTSSNQESLKNTEQSEGYNSTYVAFPKKDDTDFNSRSNIANIASTLLNLELFKNIEGKSHGSSNVASSQEDGTVLYCDSIDVSSRSNTNITALTSSSQEALKNTEQSEGHNSINVAFPKKDGTDFSSRSNIANIASTLLNLEPFKNIEVKGHGSSHVASLQEDGTVLYCDSIDVSSRSNTNITALTSSSQEALKNTEQSQGHNSTNEAFPNKDGTDFNSRSNIANIASTLLNLELFKNIEGKGHGSSNVVSVQEDGTVLYCDSMDISSRSNTNITASTSSNQEALTNTDQSKGHNSTNVAFPKEDGTNFNGRSNIANIASTLLNLEVFKNIEGKGHGSSNVASLQEDGTALYCDSMNVSSRSNTNSTASTSSNQEALKNTEQSKGHNSTNEAFPNKDGTNFNSRSNIANVASTLLNLELFKNTEGKGHGSSNVASLQEDGTVLYCDSMDISSRSNTNITASTSSNQETLKNTEQSQGHNSTNVAFPNKDGTDFNSRSNIANIASTLLNLELFKNIEGKGHGSSNVVSVQEDGTVLYCDSMDVSSRSHTNITASTSSNQEALRNTEQSKGHNSTNVAFPNKDGTDFNSRSNIANIASTLLNLELFKNIEGKVHSSSNVASLQEDGTVYCDSMDVSSRSNTNSTASTSSNQETFKNTEQNKDHISRNMSALTEYNTHINSTSNGHSMLLPSTVHEEGLDTFKYSESIYSGNYTTPGYTTKNDQTKTDLEKQTRIDTGRKNTYLDIVDMLVGQSSTVVDIEDENGCTPLHLAVLKGRLDIVEVLVKHNANINAKDNRGRTPLQLAVKENRLDIIKLLQQHDTDVNNQDTDGWSALHTAVWEGQLETVKYLILECHADKNAVNNDGSTAVHLAASGGQLETLKFLVESGIDVGVRNKDGRTALHLTALGDPSYTSRFFGMSEETKHNVYVRVVNFLLEHGLDVNSKDSNGDTAAELAEREGHLAMAKHLKVLMYSKIPEK